MLDRPREGGTILSDIERIEVMKDVAQTFSVKKIEEKVESMLADMADLEDRFDTVGVHYKPTDEFEDWEDFLTDITFFIIEGASSVTISGDALEKFILIDDALVEAESECQLYEKLYEGK